MSELLLAGPLKRPLIADVKHRLHGLRVLAGFRVLSAVDSRARRMLVSDGGSAEVIRALIIIGMRMIGISGVDLIRAMRLGGHAPLGRSQRRMDLVMLHLRSNGMQRLFSTWREE